MRRIGLLTCALATSFLAAACGGSSSGGSSAAPAFDKPASTAAANKALLTTADFPSGWTSSPSDDSDSAKVDAQLATCMQVSPTLFGSPGPDGVEVDSPDFNAPGNNGESVSETVDVGTTAKADAEFALLHSSKLPGCLDSVFGPYLKQSLAKDPSTKNAKVGTPTTKSLAFPSLGDETDAFTFTVPFELQGQTATVYLDFVFIRNHNSAAQLVFTNILSPFDVATAESLSRAALAKLTAANIPAA